MDLADAILGAKKMQLDWTVDSFPGFGSGILSPHRGDGVYIVAKRSTAPGLLGELAPKKHRAVYVGSGDRIARLREHSDRADILGHGSGSELVVFTAYVPVDLSRRVERYLANALHPLVGDLHPDEQPQAVNLPAVEWEPVGLAELLFAR